MRSPRLLALLLAGAVVLLGTTTARAQRPDTLSDAARISLVTVLPGDAVYSMYGHSALRVYDPAQELDVSFNYGTFDFDAYFVPRFIYGELDYLLSVHPYPRARFVYEHIEHRPIIEQVLNLTPAERAEVFRFLQVNALPENRYYRYDFLFDNCSTRIRDVLAQALGDRLQFAPVPDPDESFRDLLDPYAAGRPFLDFGIDLLLGTPTDRIATPYQTMFLPVAMKGAFEHAVVLRDGEPEPFVVRTDTVYWNEAHGTPGDAWPWPSMLLWALFVVGVYVTLRNHRRGTAAARLLDVPLFAVTGLAGLLVVFLWFISLHDVTAYNWNLLWMWPTHLVAAVLLFRWRPARTGRGRGLRRYLLVAAGVTLVAAAGWFLWPQELHPAALPWMLLLALRSGWLAFAPPRHPPA